jgi:uncharacterized pyridoxal phosphate-containing UPF0001 family protein
MAATGEPSPAPPPALADIAGQVERARQRIGEAGGDPDRVRIVAVTKGFDVAITRAALVAGLVDLGESYAQELMAKAADLDADPVVSGAGRPSASPSPTRLVPRWHMIGRLQRNKVRALAPHVHLWQSVDRLDLGTEIARRAPGASVLAQVNVTGEPHKGGCTPTDLDGLVAGLVDAGLEVRGLMAVGRAGDAATTREGFAWLVAAADRLGLPERSIGMSDDLELAVAAGATMVRLGRDLFGPRPPR